MCKKCVTSSLLYLIKSFLSEVILLYLRSCEKIIEWDKAEYTEILEIHRDSLFTHREKPIDNHIPLVQTYHPTTVSTNKLVIKEWKQQQYKLNETFIL